jgi:hypothetical protein
MEGIGLGRQGPPERLEPLAFGMPVGGGDRVPARGEGGAGQPAGPALHGGRAVAALGLIAGSAGTRPPSLTSLSCALARWGTSKPAMCS